MKIREYVLGADSFAYLNEENGRIVYSKTKISLDGLKTVSGYWSPFNMDRTIDKYSVFSLGFNISSKCNLSCAYCFVSGRKDIETASPDFIKEKIIEFLNKNIYCKRLFIDLSGVGEPLFALRSIIDLAKWCKQLGDSKGIEIVVNFVCNGTLLSESVINSLQNNNILFGVSIDGVKEYHDSKRRDLAGNPTYKKVVSAIGEIKDKHLFGVCMTLDSSFDGDILASYQAMYEIAPTFSIRLCRSKTNSFDESNLKRVIAGYVKLKDFLLANLPSGNYGFFDGLINGDDAFAKILTRVLIGRPTNYPCEGLVARYTCTGKGIYPCAPASVDDVFKVDGFFVPNREFNALSMSDIICHDCYAKRFCGGECPLVLKARKEKDLFNCELRRAFVDISIQFASSLMNNDKVYKTVLRSAWSRAIRNRVIE